MDYRINGYDLYLAFGIVPDGDKSTANSFEQIHEMKPIPSYDWEDEDGIEYNLLAPVKLKAREFVIKGHLVVDNVGDYLATRDALSSVLQSAYVTIEAIQIDVKVNATLKGVPKWNRLSDLAGKVVVAVEFRFDEVMQSAPFIDNGQLDITYLVNNELRIYTTQDDKNMTIS